MLDALKQEVYEANLALVKSSLVVLTWGNVSGIDRDLGLVVIKPSGVAYDQLKVADMVVVDLEGNRVEGQLKPSSDTKTHLALYRQYPQIGGIVHTHSRMATCFAQAGQAVVPYGTTHADYFSGTIPCTRSLMSHEIFGDYETETGRVIIETLEGQEDFSTKGPMAVPAILVQEHGPFTWGKDAKEALYHSIVLEEVCAMAYHTVNLNPQANLQQNLLTKHYQRKHGAGSYYGQA